MFFSDFRQEGNILFPGRIPWKYVAVDGRNPAPLDRYCFPLFTGFYTSQLVSRISEPSTVSSPSSAKGKLHKPRFCSIMPFCGDVLFWASPALYPCIHVSCKPLGIGGQKGRDCRPCVRYLNRDTKPSQAKPPWDCDEWWMFQGAMVDVSRGVRARRGQHHAFETIWASRGSDLARTVGSCRRACGRLLCTGVIVGRGWFKKC